MKKASLIFIVILVLVSCWNKEYDPVSTVKNFVFKVDHLEFDEARKMTTEKYSPIFNLIVSQLKPESEEAKREYIKGVAERTYDYELISKGDSIAVVAVTANGGTKLELIMKFHLVKKDGKWLIDDQQNQ